MKPIALATLVVALGVAGGAAAQSSKEPVPTPPGSDRTDQVSFEHADKNKDGKINREEGNDIAGFDFSRADTNDDKVLTKSEFQAAMARSTPRGDGAPGPHSGDRTAQGSFDSVDSNKDGKVDRDEAARIPGFNFSSADVDDNASLSRQEFQTAMANSTPRG